jgi:hypothetical protein
VKARQFHNLRWITSCNGVAVAAVAAVAVVVLQYNYNITQTKK